MPLQRRSLLPYKMLRRSLASSRRNIYPHPHLSSLGAFSILPSSYQHVRSISSVRSSTGLSPTETTSTSTLRSIPLPILACLHTSSRRDIPDGVSSTNTSAQSEDHRLPPSSSNQPPSSASLPESTDTSVESTDLFDVYKSLVARGLLKWDAEQARCIIQLRSLLLELKDYSPPLDLVRQLSPDAPYLARKARKEGLLKSKTWWQGLKEKASTLATTDKGKEVGRDQGWREKSLVRVLSGEEELAELQTPKGILLIGPPGTGKSHLMSLFFSLLPTTHKARHHYHPFMLSLYQAVWRRTQARMNAISPESREESMDKVGADGWRSIFAGGAYAGEGGVEEQGSRRVAKTGEEEKEGIAFGIARDMILQYHILYFDELQLVDASSASLLRDIMSWYWRLGGVIVATSNRLPDDLYHHGIQRERMSSFLEALKTRCSVYELNGGKDYRLSEEEDVEVDANGLTEAEHDSLKKLVKRKGTWFGQDKRVEFEKAVEEVTQGQPGTPTFVSVYGRKVRVPWAVGNVARFSFEDLCEEALGSADYITLSSRFETFVIDDVPYLYLKHKNQARRLINLVDALYESKCKIIISSEATPRDLFFPDAIEEAEDNNDSIMAQESVSEAMNEPARPNVSSYSSQPTGDASRMFKRRDKPAHPSEETTASFKALGIFTGEDERFAYKRAVSRLIEMSQSATYASQPWQPLHASNRKWEEIALSRPPPPPSYMKTVKIAEEATTTAASKLSDVGTETKGTDFADEAAYSRSVDQNGNTPQANPQQASGPVIGNGVDILQVSRFAALVERRGDLKLAQRILSPRELQEYKDIASRTPPNLKGLMNPKIRYLATRWTAKEATYKSISHRIPKLTWKQVDVYKQERRPMVRIDDSAFANSAATPNFQLSISHDGDYVTAYVIAEEGKLNDAPYKRSSTGNRNGPPIIDPKHVWGVREDWGEKAGEWGKGASAKQRKDD